jgi:Tol biopolymer transport system component
MRYRRGTVLLLAAVVLVGCMSADQEASIPPLSAVGGHADPGLGPGTHPLSSGPGYKGSPSWSPHGDRIAFTVDGYVVDKPTKAGGVRRWTTKDFVAEDVEWISGSSLAIFGSSSNSVPASDEATRSVYRARSQQGSLEVEEVATEVLATSPGPEGEGSIVVLETGPEESSLELMQDNGMLSQLHTIPIDGRVTGLSLSPDGRKVVMAVRPPGDREPSELRVLDLWEGVHRRIVRLRQDLGILGAPQWTTRGICYVAARRETSGGRGTTLLYDLYLVPPDSDTPERTPGVGEDFVASSIRVSPDGKRLALIGRLNPSSPINLYVLDLASESLEALTSNEEMEIKTGPDDLAWSPDGESVAIVARGALSEEPRVRAAPADTLLEDFYNLYEVPVDEGHRETR